MRTIALVVLLFCFADGFAQRKSKAEKAFDEAYELMVDEDLPAAREAFEKFIKDHVWSSLMPRAHYNVGYISFLLKDYERASRNFIEIIDASYNETDVYGGLMEQYTLYKHRSARQLAIISVEMQRWDDAERYIRMFDKEFPYEHFCGNEWEAYDIFKATITARLNEGRGDIPSAIRQLVPYINENWLASTIEAETALKDILTRNFSHEQLVAEMNASLAGVHATKRDDVDVYVFSFFGAEAEIHASVLEGVESVEAAQKILRSRPVFAMVLGK